MADASAPLPLLPTTVVGSHARPSWWWLTNEAIQEGRFGERDIAETLDRGVDIAILDQERLGAFMREMQAECASVAPSARRRPR